MALSTATRPRPAFLVALGLAVVAAVAVPIGMRWHAQHEQAVADRMTAIARQVQLPPDATALRLYHDCNGTDLIACGWTPERDVDTVAQASRTALTLAAGRPAHLRCDTYHLSDGAARRSCSVSVVEGSHSVSVSLDPYSRSVGRRLPTHVGTQYLVIAD